MKYQGDRAFAEGCVRALGFLFSFRSLPRVRFDKCLATLKRLISTSFY